MRSSAARLVRRAPHQQAAPRQFYMRRLPQAASRRAQVHVATCRRPAGLSEGAHELVRVWPQARGHAGGCRGRPGGSCGVERGFNSPLTVCVYLGSGLRDCLFKVDDSYATDRESSRGCGVSPLALKAKMSRAPKRLPYTCTNTLTVVSSSSLHAPSSDSSPTSTLCVARPRTSPGRSPTAGA